jgi:Domain of unknown function (DUF4375)
MSASDDSKAPCTWSTIAEERVHRIILNRDDGPETMYVMYICAFIEEVNNGGLSQFFYNSGGDRALEALEALQAIGSTETLSILRAAFSLFPAGKPHRLTEERQRELEAIPDSALDALDERFYDRREDLYTLLIAKWESQLQNGSLKHDYSKDLLA